ncbi:MAG TPA: hypothetical protein DEO84_09590 [candidate division Zixibacteria bacterium]|nr:hypothetical protein [candidate division Zixibacteria bacterium]
MKREIPILIVGITGVILFLQYFIPTDWSMQLLGTSQDWVIVIGILALPLGIWSLVKANIMKLQVKGERFYAAVLLTGFLVMLIFGLPHRSSLEQGSTFMTLFNTILIPIQATIFSLLAFFVASAAYRAFRARSVLATILLLTAFLVMFRWLPLGFISTADNAIVAWILSVPNMAANRAIGMGIGLGGAAMAIKIILGIERTYMGHD